MAHRRISIPMRGMMESLNLSVTASIFLLKSPVRDNNSGVRTAMALPQRMVKN